MKKRCCRCGKKRLLKFFTKNKTKKDGHNPSCTSCHRKYVNEHYRKNRGAYIEKAKERTKRLRDFVNALKSAPCADCRIPYPPWVMDFDHREASSKEYDVSTLASMGSESRILAEVQKCDVVCSNCHRQRTHDRMSS